jgi:sulfur relay (sulfurtransferase) DsrF/TusC family protein
MGTGLRPEAGASGQTTVSALREKLIQEITAAAEAMIADTEASSRHSLENARNEFQRIEKELRTQLDAALADIETRREQARSLISQLAVERAAKERAEASLAEAVAVRQQTFERYTAQVQVLERSLESARWEEERLASDLERESAERKRLADILESVRLALGPGTAVATASRPNDPSPVAGVENAHSETGVVEGHPQTEMAAAPARNLTLVASDVTETSWAQQLLEELEASYTREVGRLERPADVVEWLVKELRKARELFLARCSAGEAAFDRQMSIVLDTKGHTAFGRHLGIAWYDVSQPTQRSRPSAVA